MPKPACVKCQRFYRPKRNGIFLLEGMPIVNEAAPGTSHPEDWQPYKLWAADLWECEGCGHELISHYAREPIDVQHTATFAANVKSFAPEIQINDC